MESVLSFVHNSAFLKLPRCHGNALSPRRRRMVSCATKGEPNKNDNADSENDNGAKEQGQSQLPPGSASSKSRNSAELGFVGAERIGISFVCTAENCNTRIAKSVRRRSYEKGTVIIQCPTCKKHHVVADNFGMYSSLTNGRVNIEEIAKAQGQSVTRVDDSVFKLENVFGKF